MVLVAGHFKIVGESPDEDSVRFYPDDVTIWDRLPTTVKANASGGVQLRLDAIDALETHYTPPHAPAPWRRPATLGDGAGAQLLELLGFTDVVRDTQRNVTSSTPDTCPGYILTRFADKYGRPVSLAYAGNRPDTPDAAAAAPPPSDRGLVYVTVPELRRSVNWQLLEAGWVYPTFYSKLYVDLRRDLSSTAVAARAAGRGVWQDDATLPGFTLLSRAQLRDELVILPKLFRRLAEYLTLDDTGGTSLTGFSAFLSAHDDRLFTVPDGHATSLDTLVAVTGQRVQLTVRPEQIVFEEG